MSPDISQPIEDHVLKSDISLLDKLGCSDNVMATLAIEHACRVLTLMPMIDPTMGRFLLTKLASNFVQKAAELEA